MLSFCEPATEQKIINMMLEFHFFFSVSVINTHEMTKFLSRQWIDFLCITTWGGVFFLSPLIGQKMIRLWEKNDIHNPMKSARELFRYYVNFDNFQKKKKTFQSGIISLKINIHLQSFIKAITLSNSNSLCCCCSCCSAHKWNWKQNGVEKNHSRNQFAKWNPLNWASYIFGVMS